MFFHAGEAGVLRRVVAGALGLGAGELRRLIDL